MKGNTKRLVASEEPIDCVELAEMKDVEDVAKALREEFHSENECMRHFIDEDFIKLKKEINEIKKGNVVRGVAIIALFVLLLLHYI